MTTTGAVPPGNRRATSDGSARSSTVMSTASRQRPSESRCSVASHVIPGVSPRLQPQVDADRATPREEGQQAAIDRRPSRRDQPRVEHPDEDVGVPEDGRREPAA
ncbi:hypothetical protein ACRAWB_01795 [Leifsonia poae]|uniref:hypothetical protein n=1 Tax=Leifsonia poae TaxID=110933 RepID=UPI003D681FB3